MYYSFNPRTTYLEIFNADNYIYKPIRKLHLVNFIYIHKCLCYSYKGKYIHGIFVIIANYVTYFLTEGVNKMICL